MRAGPILGILTVLVLLSGTAYYVLIPTQAPTTPDATLSPGTSQNGTGETTAPSSNGTLPVETPGGPSESTGPRVVADASRQANASIGPSGGTLNITIANGTALALTVPSTVLAEEVNIWMAPLTHVPQWPTSLLGGALFGPDGLTFREPALFTLEFAEGTLPEEATGLVAFKFDGTGTNLTPVPFTLDGNTVTLEVHHFSGAGLARAGTPGDVFAALSRGSDPCTTGWPTAASAEENTARASLVQILCGLPANATFPVEVESTLITWFDTGVKPHLAAMATWKDYVRFRQEGMNWTLAAQVTGNNNLTSLINTELPQAQREAFTRVKTSTVQECAGARTNAAYRMHAERLANLTRDSQSVLGRGTYSDGTPITLVAVIDGCVKVSIDRWTGPDWTDPGVDTSFTLQPRIHTRVGNATTTPYSTWRIDQSAVRGTVTPATTHLVGTVHSGVAVLGPDQHSMEITVRATADIFPGESRTVERTFVISNTVSIELIPVRVSHLSVPLPHPTSGSSTYHVFYAEETQRFIVQVRIRGIPAGDREVQATATGQALQGPLRTDDEGNATLEVARPPMQRCCPSSTYQMPWLFVGEESVTLRFTEGTRSAARGLDLRWGDPFAQTIRGTYAAGACRATAGSWTLSLGNTISFQASGQGWRDSIQYTGERANLESYTGSAVRRGTSDSGGSWDEEAISGGVQATLRDGRIVGSLSFKGSQTGGNTDLPPPPFCAVSFDVPLRTWANPDP